jgi:putative lipoprotein (rSAM/lipoprotein system)
VLILKQVTQKIETMKIKLLKTYNVIIAALLAILGFSSCTAPDEYGTPEAKFIVKGKVSSKETQQPVENIRVTMNWDANFTNGEGNYHVANLVPPTYRTFLVQFHDTLGAYMDLDTLIEFKDPKFTGGDKKWYEGETSKTVDIQLTAKDDSN